VPAVVSRPLNSDAGFNRHLSKPIDVIELMRVLEIELAKRFPI